MGSHAEPSSRVMIVDLDETAVASERAAGSGPVAVSLTARPRHPGQAILIVMAVERVMPPLEAQERAMLSAFLDFHRETRAAGELGRDGKQDCSGGRDIESGYIGWCKSSRHGHC